MAEPTDRLNPDLTRRRFLQGTALAGVARLPGRLHGRQRRVRRAAGRARPATPASRRRRRSPRARRRPSPTPKPSSPGPLHWAQWPAYIDLTGKAGDAGAYAPGSSPTLEEFKEKYSVDVNYEEKIEDNEDFFARSSRSSWPACRPAGT